MISHKPRIFISSTIYDFHDLRSALKYWLEQLGYEVWLSEFNDVEKSLDTNALEACLQAIAKSDYYILLIGSRMGGFYDETKSITITRKEYRTAYSLFETGKLRLVLFVRSELWTVRSDREALRQYLENATSVQQELEPASIDAIANHSSSYATNPEVLFSFIDEITRSEETKQAIKGEGAFPSGNWVHQFRDFSEIIEVLRLELNIQNNLSRIALSINLKNELLANLTEMLTKGNADVIISSLWTKRARQKIKGGSNDFSEMPAEFVRHIFLFLIIKPTAEKLSTLYINEALSSGEFLEYDVTTNSFSAGLLVNRLFDLRRIIENMKGIAKIIDGKVIVALDHYWRGKRDDDIINVKNDDLTVAFAYSDAVDNAVELCIGLIQALEGNINRLNKLVLRPNAPFADEEEKISQERVSVEEAYSWLNSLNSE